MDAVERECGPRGYAFRSPPILARCDVVVVARRFLCARITPEFQKYSRRRSSVVVAPSRRDSSDKQ